ncbi:MAG: hypothetical protein IJF01_06055 [Tidjanibacter sp.]|nr:hypothetical protein [Tidjanibacter sp.]
MMVIPVKIAAASTLSAVPLVYGLRSAANLEAEITLLSREDSLDALIGGTVDIALLSADQVCGLAGVKIVSDFCIAPVKGFEGALTQEWGVGLEAPVAAVWVAREGLLPEVLDAFEVALTLGVERIYESLMALAECPRIEDYTFLSTQIDYLFDAKKHKALEAYWKRLKKATAHANPG